MSGYTEPRIIMKNGLLVFEKEDTDIEVEKVLELISNQYTVAEIIKDYYSDLTEEDFSYMFDQKYTIPQKQTKLFLSKDVEDNGEYSDLKTYS